MTCLGQDRLIILGEALAWPGMAVLDAASLGQGEAGVDRPGPGAPERALALTGLPLPDLGAE